MGNSRPHREGRRNGHELSSAARPAGSRSQTSSRDRSSCCSIGFGIGAINPDKLGHVGPVADAWAIAREVKQARRPRD